MTKQNGWIFSGMFLILLLACGSESALAGIEEGGTTVNRKSAVVKQLAKSTQSWNGATLPAYPQGQPEITILRINIPAGARLEVHSHPVINSGVLLSGQLTVVTQDGKTLHLKAGDPIIEIVNTLHYGINEGDAPADIIVFYAGTAGSPITVVKPQ
jgi:quercetin dioxygenase-like cupin family protein